MSETKVMKKLTGCARCSGTHENLEYKPFSKHPIEDTDGTIWDSFAICPITNEPILVKTEQLSKEDQ